MAKFRAARRMWDRIMTERFGAKDEQSKLLRFHTQTGGSTLTAQQPENNVVRTTLQALAAVLGGTQCLHTNGFDEALGLPTERAAKIALRTQQIIAYESGVTDTADPLAGSYFVESLTDAVEAEAWRYIEKIDAMGGAVAAIEAGFMQDEIEQAAYQWAKARRRRREGHRRREPVRRAARPCPRSPPDRPGPGARAGRAPARAAGPSGTTPAVKAALEDVRAAARGTQNLLVPMKEALKRLATLGEVSDVLREEFGVYHPAR